MREINKVEKEEVSQQYTQHKISWIFTTHKTHEVCMNWDIVTNDMEKNFESHIY